MHWITLIFETLAHIGGGLFLWAAVQHIWITYNMSEKLKALLGIKSTEGMFKILTYRMGTVTTDVPLEFTGKDAYDAILHAMEHENAKPGDLFYATEGDQLVALGLIDWNRVKRAHWLDKEPIDPLKMSNASLTLLMSNENLKTRN